MFESTWKKISVVLVMGVFLGLGAGLGCNRGPSSSDDPKAFLQEYISQSFTVSTLKDREVLAHYLTGPAKNRLVAWSDEQFMDAFIQSKRQFVRLIFTEVKTVSPKEVAITYELTFLDQGKGHDAKVTNKKLAQLVREQDRWFIAEVRNVKELIEYKNELSLP
jgi:hypothetical protein